MCHRYSITIIIAAGIFWQELSQQHSSRHLIFTEHPSFIKKNQPQHSGYQRSLQPILLGIMDSCNNSGLVMQKSHPYCSLITNTLNNVASCFFVSAVWRYLYSTVLGGCFFKSFVTIPICLSNNIPLPIRVLFFLQHGPN